MDKYLGKRLEGRYEILELIGMGGMANVYKAFDLIDQRDVAVKILRDEYIDNAEFLRRFKNESKAIAVLSHPNIVRVYDVSFTNRVHSIVMEYIDGITLKDYIDRQSVLTWKEAVHFTLQILRALQHAHEKGIVHRDIKPQNIMLLQNGTIKVTDFGIARFARSEVRTISDRAIGSVHYISPEQAMGHNTDQKSDIYSVGVMLFEMLTGTLPFEADSAVSVAIKQIQSQAVRPTSINPSIPEGLEDITIRAMQKDAGQRYQSAAEMIADIEAFKQDPSIHFAYKYQDEGEGARSKKYRRAIMDAREEDTMHKRKRTPYIPILTGVTMAFVLASLVFIGLMIYSNNPFTKVDEDTLPSLIGLKYEDDLRRRYDFFKIERIEPDEYNAEYGFGVIYEQEPRAGQRIKKGSTVKVKVSAGQQIATLPQFKNHDAKQVFKKLEDMGLVYKEVSAYDENVPSGSVIYTDPSSGTEVAAGTVVTVYVSRGPEQRLATVPRLVGGSLEDATRLLEQARLRLGNVTYEASDQPPDTVIGQNPAQRELQPEGTLVDLVVSKAGAKRVRLQIDLPNVDRVISIRARDPEKILTEETFNPQEVGGVWRPVISGEEGETVEVRIFIDKKLYQRYQVNMDTGEAYLDRDRSDEPEFQ